MSKEKTYTLEQAKSHGRDFIEKQAKILKKNLENKKVSQQDISYV